MTLFRRNKLFGRYGILAAVVLAGAAFQVAAQNNCTRKPDGTLDCNFATITVIGSSGGFGGSGGMTSGGGGSRDDVYNESQSPMDPDEGNSGQTQPGEQNGNTESDCKGGNPVILSNGNKVEEETDFLFGFRSQHPLYLTRTYSHYWKGVGLFGKHWLSPYDYKLSFGTTDIDACHARPGGGTCGIGANTVIWSWRPDGRTVRYVKAPDGVFYEEHPAPVAKIVQQANGEFWLYDGSGGVERYSSAGYVGSVTDPYGIAWTWTYSGTYPTRVTHTSGRYVEFTWSGSQLTAVRDPAGNHFGYAYHANAFGTGLHRLAATSRPGAPVTTIAYHYEASGLPGALTGKSYGGVRYSWFAYSASGYAIETNHGGGIERNTFAYNPLGNGVMEVTQTNPLGKQGKYTFTNGSITSYAGYPSTHCAATYSERTHDANGFENLVADFNGNITDYDYAANGRLIRMVEAAGTPQARTTEYVWDNALGRTISMTVVGHRRIEYTYAADGRVATITETNLSAHGVANQSRTTTYAYTKHANGMLATVTVDGPVAGNGDAVVSTFNAQGDLLSVLDSLGYGTTYSNHDGLGRPGRSVGANGDTTDFVYDGQGRALTVRRWVAGVAADTAYAYGANGLLASITTPDGVVVNHVYDAARRRTRIWRNAGGTVVDGAIKEDRVYAYDAMSNIIRIDDRKIVNGYETRCTRWFMIEGNLECVEEEEVPVEVPQAVKTVFIDYDQLGRIRAKRGNNGQNERYAYDLNGNLKTVTDSFNRATTFDYDALDRVIASTDAVNGITRIEYNPDGLINKVTDPKNLITTYVHDGFRQLWAQHSPDTGSTTHQHNAGGQRTLTTRNDGSTLSYAYDALGRITWYGTSTEGRGYSYDWCTNGKTRLCAADYSNGTKHYAYTPEGWTQATLDWTPSTSDYTAYARDNMGRVTGIYYPSGVVAGYGYTAGKVTLMNMTGADGVSNTVASNIKYQPFGAVDGWDYGNGLTRRYHFDQNLNPGDQRLTGITTMNGGATVQSLSMQYDANDLIAKITNFVDTNATQDFGYDAVGRLTSAATAANTATFAYDGVGNRTGRTDNGAATTYAYGATNHRLQSAVSAGLSRSFTTNTVGNIDAWTGTDGVQNTMTYDAYLRPRTHARNGFTTTYTFNALDQRVLKYMGGGNSVRFVYEGQNKLLAERVTSGSGSGSQWTTHLWLGGQPLAVVKGNTVYWVHGDQLGRPEMATNAAKQVVWRAGNWAFNRSVFVDSIGGYQLGLPGQYLDTESGLWHNGFRTYEPTLGRYLQSDPIGLMGGISTYGYASGNPVSRVDPLGLADIFTTLDIDLTGGVGFDISFGMVIDTDTPGDSGYYISIGESAGVNVGVGLGVGAVCRDIEGKGANLDVNAGKVSPTLSFDDRGFNGASLTVGPGWGVSGSTGTTYTLSVNSVINYIKGD